MLSRFMLLLSFLPLVFLFQNCAGHSSEEIAMINSESNSSNLDLTDNSTVQAKASRTFDRRGLNFSSVNGPLKTTSGKINRTRSGLYLTTTSSKMRAYDSSSNGDVGSLQFKYRGRTKTVSKLASGSIRQQVGVKLRATDSCNLLYIMWQVYPSERIVVSRKENRGKKTHSQCGANGYTTLKTLSVPRNLSARSKKTRYLSAEIVSERYLNIYVNYKLHRSIPLDSKTRSFLKRTRHGHAGLRSDNASLIFKYMVER